MKKISLDLPGAAAKYQIIIGADILSSAGAAAREYLGENARRLVIVSNRKVFGLYGETVKRSVENAGYEVFVFLIGDGEKYKSLRTLEKTLAFLSEKNLKRADAIIALGGGVVGDLAGFAAAVYLRGIAFLQIPTTFLAMIDSSVGGKTGVNTAFGKNLVGAFHQPRGVLIDTQTLRTLPRRELTAGLCEAVKQAAVGGGKLFEQTADFLQTYNVNDFKKHFSNRDFSRELEEIIRAQIAFKAEIVSQDERESANRNDAKSRKILNFGHTLAHALEKATAYKRFRHGEAVGYGIRFAAELSKKLEIFDEYELNLLNDVLRRVGNLPATHNVSLEQVFQAFAFDKKIFGESLEWILLERIGKPIIIENKKIPPDFVQETLKKVLRN